MVTIMSNRIDTIYGFSAAEAWALALVRKIDRAVTAMLNAIYDSRRRVAARHLLASLDDRMLKDLGLNRCDVEHEIRKRFWQE
jgi:uncharacterized protein YjiS (DUF1127 family)